MARTILLRHELCGTAKYFREYHGDSKDLNDYIRHIQKTDENAIVTKEFIELFGKPCTHFHCESQSKDAVGCSQKVVVEAFKFKKKFRVLTKCVEVPTTDKRGTYKTEIVSGLEELK